MSFQWGNKLRISVFGQSHSEALGVSIEGLPAGERVDLEELKAFLRRRAPGRSDLSSPRQERDEPQILCGLIDGLCCGSPLTILFRNEDPRPQDYEALRDVPRPGHADLAAAIKYEGYQDHRGGGSFSGRMTAPLCAAGGVCLQLLSRRGITVAAHILSVGEAADRPFDPLGLSIEERKRLREAELPVLEPEAEEAFREEIRRAAAEGDSVGGVIEAAVLGLPAGLGGPLFGGLDGKLASALFAIPAVKGVEFGEGFAAARLRGSLNNDPYGVKEGKVMPETNHAGGVLGGISTGMPLLFRVAIKPTPSIALPQRSVSLSTLEPKELSCPGRNDPCIVPRAVPAVEAVAALTVLDLLLGGD